MRPREYVIMAAAAALLAWQLLLPGFIGLADNGDFGKVAGRLCIGGPDSGADNFVFFRSQYVRGPGSCYNSRIPTSELTVAWVASAIELRLSDSRQFDIRWLGALHALLWMGAYGLLLFSIRPLTKARWWIAAAFSLFIFMDVAYVANFNSFYTDAVALVGGLAMAAALPLMLARPGFMWAFGAAAFLFATSKGQHGLLAVVPVAVLACVAWPRGAGILSASRLSGRLQLSSKQAGRETGSPAKCRPHAAFIACVVAAGAVWVAVNNPNLNTVSPRFSLIFSKLLPTSETPLRDAAELGLIDADLKYIGSRAFLPDSPTGDPEWVRQFCLRNSNATLARFYLNHPITALRFLRDDLFNQAWKIRAGNLSNYRREAGHPPGARTTRMGWWSAARSWMLERWPVHMFLWYGLVLIGGSIWSWRKRSTFAWAAVFAAVMGLGEFAVASLGDALETGRHLLLFHLFTDASVVFAIIAFAAARPVRTQSGIPMPS
jgi:hypothetical protein